MKDLIYRQAAIDKLEPWLRINGYSEGELNMLKAVLYELENMPSAQPECESGEWIRNDNGTYSCSVCQSWIPEEQHYYARYCLYCGAKMRSEDNG